MTELRPVQPGLAQSNTFTLHRAGLPLPLSGLAAANLSTRCHCPTGSNIQNRLRGGYVPIMGSATFTLPSAHAKRQLGGNQPAVRANTRATLKATDLNHFAAIPLRFIGQLPHQFVATNISNSFSQLLIFQHAGQVQVFRGNKAVSADQAGSQLVQKVSPTAGSLALNLRNPDTGAMPAARPLNPAAEYLLSTFQLPLVFLNKLRVARFSAVAGNNHVLDAEINSNRFVCRRQFVDFDFATYGHVIIANRVMANRGHLGDACYGLRPAQLELAELGEYQRFRSSIERPVDIALVKLVACRLWAAFALELRETRPFGVEIGKGPVLIPQGLGDGRAVGVFEPSVSRIGFQFGDGAAAICARHGAAQRPIAEASRVQRGIPRPAGHAKIDGQLLALSGVGVKTEFVGNRANHMEIIADFKKRSANGRRDQRANSRRTGGLGRFRKRATRSAAKPAPHAIPSTTGGVFVRP